MLFSKYLRVPFLRAIEVKGWLRLNFGAATSKSCNHFWKFGCQLWKSKADLFMTNGSKGLIYLSFFIVPQRLILVSIAKRKIPKPNKSELWNRLSYKGLPYFLRLAAKLSEMIAKFQGWRLKIQPWSSFHLNGLKNSMRKYFGNSLKIIPNLPDIDGKYEF
jgi:hypothetical protein